MKRIPPALSLSFVCWPNSPVVSLFTDYKVPKGLRLWMSDLNDDFPSACRRQQQQSVVSLLLQLLYKHVSGVKKRLHELCLTFQTSIHRPDANCGLDSASMRHRCATRVYTSIMQYKKWAGQQSSQLGDKISQLYVCLQKDTVPCVCMRESFFHRRVWAPLVVPQLYAGYESIDWNDQVQKEMWGLLICFQNTLENV